MKRLVFAVLLLVVCFGCSSHEQPSSFRSGGPHLSLTAQPRQGFPPLRVTFHVTLEGVVDNDETFYCLREQWEFGDGAVSAEKPHCEPFTPETKITKEFFVDHLYQSVGVQQARFKLGDDLKSNQVGISVLENQRGPGR